MAINENTTPDTFASDSGVSKDRINSETGEIINPTASEISSFNESFDTIQSNDLINQPTSDFNTFKEQPVAPLPEVPELKLTEGEEKVQTGMEDIASLNKQLLGESAFTTQQETAQGIPGLLQTQTDLQNRIKTLTAEQQAIPLSIQQESIGRGRTAGGVAPIQTARLRENAINALSTNALLQATQGNISTAQTLVDRAVAQKYDPIREKLKVKAENLQLIIDSPKYSLEQKKRAETQKTAIDARNSAITKQESDDKAIMGVATEVAKFGASVEVLTAIRDAKSPLEAIAIAQTTGFYDQAKIQQDFENSLKTGEFNLKKQKLESDIMQQAVDENISLLNLKLNRDKYTTDTEFKNANLALDKMKTQYTVDKIQADIDKIYDDIARKDEVTIDDMKKINDLQEAKDKKISDEKAKNIQLGNEYEEVSDTLGDLEKMLGLTGDKDSKDMLGSVVGTGLGNKPLRERLSKGFLKDPDAQWFRGKLRQLTSKATLGALVGLKAKGGTLGAISEKELAILESSALVFNEWEVKEKDANGNMVNTGAWNISEDLFRKELTKVYESQKRLQEAVLNERLANTDEYTNAQDFETFATDEQVEAFDEIKSGNPGVSDEDIIDLMNEQIRNARSQGYGSNQDFNNVGSDTQIAPISVNQFTLGSRLAKVNNNPGNLRLAGQTGATQGESGFAKFETPEQGFSALFNDLKAKFTGNSPAIRGKLGRNARTLKEVISVYAPKEDSNDPDSYAQFVAKRLGVSPNEPVSNLINRLDEVTKAFASKESSSTFS